ncbi:hypothetical protein C8J57DRAFT_1298013 [Mycena rebaudengoi]|nr:hypothetical protein C8J57DRAFT_1298013 [Mycena rebaudengoi]
MKLILSGSTGFIGGEVMRQCCQNPSITSIVALSRRPLPDAISADPKVQVIIMKDFKTYPEEVLKQLDGADACIWSMGTTAAIPELEIEYPMAFARAFAPTLRARETPFRYLHLSGVLAERDQSKLLLILPEGRRTKGRAETQMMAIADEPAYKGLWETYVVKPAMVLQTQGDAFKALAACITGAIR